MAGGKEMNITRNKLYVNDIGPRSRNDIDPQYSHIFINSISFRSQAAIVFEKSIFFSLFLQKSLSYKI